MKDILLTILFDYPGFTLSKTFFSEFLLFFLLKSYLYLYNCQETNTKIKE